MIKVTLLLGGILILCTAAIMGTSEGPIIVDGCKSETELWGSEDGTKFYFCLGENKSMEQNCEPNTFFVKNATVSGCIPVDVVSENCIYHSKLEKCEGIYMLQPQPNIDPTRFYLCIEVGVYPVELPCANGKAFAKQDGWMGCFNWPKWRSIRGCNSTE